MQLLEQHGLEDATTPSSLEELDFAAPSRTSTNLDARAVKALQGNSWSFEQDGFDQT